MNEEDFSKIKVKLRDKLHSLIENAEEELNAEHIIRLRKYLFHHIIEDLCTWSEEGDCLPKEIKIGAYTPYWVKLELINVDE